MRISCVAWALCWLIPSPDWPFCSFPLLFIQFSLSWVSRVPAWLTSARKDTPAEAQINHCFLPIKVCSRSPVQAGDRSTGWHKPSCPCSRTTILPLWDHQPPAQPSRYQEIRCNPSMNISTLWDVSWSMRFDVFLEEQKVWNQSALSGSQLTDSFWHLRGILYLLIYLTLESVEKLKIRSVLKRFFLFAHRTKSWIDSLNLGKAVK